MNKSDSNKTQEKEPTFPTQQQNKKKPVQDNAQDLQIQEQLKKQANLIKQIQDAEEKLRFTQDQRKKLVAEKRQKIEQDEEKINQMKTTNEQ